MRSYTTLATLVGGVALTLAQLPAQAAMLQITVENLAAPNSVSFAPLHFGVHAGVFDAFDNGAVANAATISVAEGGAGGAWQAAFGAAEPQANRGTVGGLLQPGESRSLTLDVDSLANAFFTFATMVVPSNDFFIGNDSPTQYRIFDAAGNLILNQIAQKASDIWDAGSEQFDPAAAAFVGDNGLRTPQNGVVNFNFQELAGFDGLVTGTGYVFQSGLTRDSDIYRIRFNLVPVPASAALVVLGLLAAGVVQRHTRRPR